MKKSIPYIGVGMHRGRGIHVISFIIILFAIGGLLPVASRAQEAYHFTHLRSDNGLPHQQIMSMAFDHDGMLWVGTRNGLAKYDGYSFVVYYHDPSDASSIPHNFIRKILVDRYNNVWIGTDAGISRYRRDKDDFENHDVDGQHISEIVETHDGGIVCSGDRIFRKGVKDTSFRYVPRHVEGYVTGMAVAPDGRVFVSTNQSIAYYSPSMNAETMLDASVYSDFMKGFDVLAPLYFDKKGNLWIGRDGHGVMSLNLKTGSRTIYPETVLSDGTVRDITQDSMGNILLGTEKGITVINTATGAISKVKQEFGNSRTLSDNAIYCIVPDSQDNIWVGTYFGGINLLQRNARQFRWIAPGYDSTTLSGKAVRRVIEVNEHLLWLATEDGGINMLDLTDNSVRRFNSIPELGTNVHELYYDENTGDIWIGTFRNGLFRYNTKSGAHRHYTVFNGSGLRSDAIFAVVRQKSGDLWIATTLGLKRYDPQTDSFQATGHPVLDGDFVYCLHADRKGNLWAGTVNSGLYRIDGRSREVKGWARQESGGIPDSYVTTVFEDRKGRILVGTNNSGVHIIDGKTLSASEFPCNEGAWGTVCSIGEDKTGTIWITTSGGLFKVNPENLSTVKFTTSDGLPENQFNFSSIMQASDGELYCGTVNGLVKFSPDIRKRGDRKSPVHLWCLALNSNPLTPRTKDSPLSSTLDATKELVLGYADSRIFSIDYGIVDPVGAENARYQIFIEGLDKEWRDVGSQRRFTAMELPYGSYVFKVRALTSGDNWDSAPIRELDLRIKPPYYLSSTAWFIYILLGISLCYVVYRLVTWRVREKQQKKLNQIEQEKKDELNREKMEFFTNISHELKTPLSLILAPLKHLSSEEHMSEISQERLSTAIANTSKMIDLINELVTFNRVESGNFQLFLQKGNPLELIETWSGYFRGPASEKNISVNVMTQNNGEEVWYSTTYLERILSNLLSNAIKYTGENGSVDVRASIMEGDDGDVYLQLEVKDTGIGIAPEEIDNIFKKYYQTKRGYNASHTGWGIGLATVRKLVEIHRGTIAVTSTMGEGSVFTVRINVTQDAFDKSCCIAAGATVQAKYQPTFITNTLAVYSRENEGNADDKNEKSVSILLVEDNPQLLRFLADEFSKDYNVFTATNGEEALKVTAEYPIDIVVSDVMMPVMDGIELCDRLKNDLATSHIPVILLTAKSDEETTIAGYRSGAEAYIPKPFDPQLLALRVKNILRARRVYIDSKIDESSAQDETVEELPPLNKFDNEFVERINSLINENMDNSDFSIADITKALGISRSLLHIKMKTFFNTSMTDHIKQCRMTKACELLRSGLNVSETAYATGFSDPNYFTKVFKKTFGMPPTEYLANK